MKTSEKNEPKAEPSKFLNFKIDEETFNKLMSVMAATGLTIKSEAVRYCIANTADKFKVTEAVQA